VFVSNPLPGIPLIESPLFPSLIEGMGLGDEERRIAVDLNERGYAVIDFPDPAIHERIDRIKREFAPRFGLDPEQPDRQTGVPAPRRVQDAWLENEDVRAIAANAQVLSLLARLYGRRAVPFQTLNFPVGTEQHLHSDSNHFSSIPERFMCGVWLAMEDVHADSGPLTYAPGSHKWPIVSNLMIGRRGAGTALQSAQDPFEDAWAAMLEASGIEQEVLIARKGQALIWAANLLHGGSPQRDCNRTRWSQVTHYYFENCIYYTPAHSDEPLGELALRSIVDVATCEAVPNRFLGQPLEDARKSPTQPARGSGLRFWGRKNVIGGEALDSEKLPEDFDANRYLQLNPDVAAAGHDAAEHYQKHGRSEGRAYRIG
jgi:hypothetical protein